MVIIIIIISLIHQLLRADARKLSIVKLLLLLLLVVLETDGQGLVDSGLGRDEAKEFWAV